MEYTIIIKGHSYELPQKTIAVVEELEEITNIDSIKGLSIKDKFKRLFQFIEKCVGTDNAVEILGSKRVEEVDLSDVSITVRKIIEAYAAPLREYEADLQRRQIEELPIDKIMELAKTAKAIYK